jgi:hypothetical protein
MLPHLLLLHCIPDQKLFNRMGNDFVGYGNWRRRREPFVDYARIPCLYSIRCKRPPLSCLIIELLHSNTISRPLVRLPK